MRCWFLTLRIRQTLNKQDLSFEIITKWMVLRANGAVLRMPCAPFVILLSPVVVRLGRLLIFLVERFSVKNSKYWIVCTDT
jgi:hypothetical protein